tara:strand:- start:958 stop:1257 length:300 start_codon:yes stop_codon:yes gene_type:complete
MFLFGNICAKNLGLVDDAARCLESPVWGRPVRGNGKIVQELEGDFRGAGWNVIKLLWGKGWDELLETAHERSRLRALVHLAVGVTRPITMCILRSDRSA